MLHSLFLTKETQMSLERNALEVLVGQVWDTKELQEDYTVRQFAAPYVVVERKSDKQVGSLEFQHMPRFYYTFEATKELV